MDPSFSWRMVLENFSWTTNLHFIIWWTNQPYVPAQMFYCSCYSWQGCCQAANLRVSRKTRMCLWLRVALVFYSQCLPDNTVHIGIANSSFHFLSTMLVLFSRQGPCTANTLTIALVRCWKSGHWLTSFIPFSVCVCVCVCSAYACCWCLQLELIAADKYSTLYYFTRTPFSFVPATVPVDWRMPSVTSMEAVRRSCPSGVKGPVSTGKGLLLHRAREMVKGTARLPFKCHAILSRR